MEYKGAKARSRDKCNNGLGVCPYSVEHHSKLDILSQSLHYDFLCFDLSMNSWVSLRPYVIDIIPPNHFAKETSEALSFDTRLPI